MPRSILGGWATSPVTTEFSWSRIGRPFGITVGPNSADLGLGLVAHAGLLGERRDAPVLPPRLRVDVVLKVVLEVGAAGGEGATSMSAPPLGAAPRRGGSRGRHAPNSPGNALDNMSANSTGWSGTPFLRRGPHDEIRPAPGHGSSPLMDACGLTTARGQPQRRGVQTAGTTLRTTPSHGLGTHLGRPRIQSRPRARVPPTRRQPLSDLEDPSGGRSWSQSSRRSGHHVCAAGEARWRRIRGMGSYVKGGVFLLR